MTTLNRVFLTICPIFLCLCAAMGATPDVHSHVAASPLSSDLPSMDQFTRWTALMFLGVGFLFLLYRTLPSHQKQITALHEAHNETVQAMQIASNETIAAMQEANTKTLDAVCLRFADSADKMSENMAKLQVFCASRPHD